MNRQQAQRILAHLSARQDEMVRLLKECALLESPSTEPIALAAMFDLLGKRLHDAGFQIRRFSDKISGGQLLAAPQARMRRRPTQMLVGHVDTVWPIGTLDSMPVESREGRLHGPGVYDMKGGIVQAIFALEGLRELGLEPSVTPLLFLNSDEETGSHASAAKIRRLARTVDRALILEPSLGASGQLKTSRKGVGRYSVKVLGRAAHAGLDPEKGVSAILELAHVIQTLFAMNDPLQGISVNVGTIDGGLRPNVVAPESRAEIDVRVRTQHDADVIDRAIRAMQPTVPGTALHIEGGMGRPPLESNARNRAIWNRALASAGLLGMELSEGSAGGGSDGNWTSLYTPTLDGLGAVGDGAHAVHEHVVEALMPQRAALLACLILEDPLKVDYPRASAELRSTTGLSGSRQDVG